jgi:hypothetical protein
MRTLIKNGAIVTAAPLDFVIQTWGECPHRTVAHWHKRSDPKAAIEYGCHIAITDLTPAVIDTIPSLRGQNVAYPQLKGGRKAF